jgi:hypothetical protein
VPEVPHRLQDGFFSLSAGWLSQTESRNAPGRITVTPARAIGASALADQYGRMCGQTDPCLKQAGYRGLQS